jgi:predicted ATP-grasp superfamily ATP-dependent carboligase
VTKLLAIVGASARAAAASAVRAGFQAVAADLFADADLRNIATATRIEHYPAAFIDWLQRLQPRPEAWMYTGAMENHPDLIDAMAEVAPLWGNHGTVLRQVRSPFRLAQALQEANLHFPDTRASAVGLPRDGSWLTKTGRGASGSGVRAFTDQVADQRGLYYQKRVAGPSYSAVYVAASGNADLLGVVRQLVGEPWLGAREFQYCGAVGPAHLSASMTAELARIGSVLSGRFQLVGLFGIDLVIDSGRVWTIEVNPRYTASVEVIERATGARSIVRHAATCTNTAYSDSRDASAFTPRGKAILFAKRDVKINARRAKYLLAEANQTSWPPLADIPNAATVIEAGQPVLTVFAESAASEQQVEDNLRSRVAIIEATLYS